jgi:hypothetical protein
MPNDCWNKITLTCENVEELTTLISSLESHKNITLIQKCPKGIKIKQITAWKPDYPWLESLLTNYPNCWIKNEWYEEGGDAGVWVGSKNGIKSMEWQDLSIEAQYYIFDKYKIEL